MTSGLIRVLVLRLGRFFNFLSESFEAFLNKTQLRENLGTDDIQERENGALAEYVFVQS